MGRREGEGPRTLAEGAAPPLRQAPRDRLLVARGAVGAALRPCGGGASLRGEERLVGRVIVARGYAGFANTTDVDWALPGR